MSNAIESNSPVLTPGFASSFNFERTFATNEPALRSISISLLLRSVIGIVSPVQGVEFIQNTRRNLINILVGINIENRISFSLIIANDRRGLLVIGLQPVRNHIRRIILSLDQRTAALIALAIRFRL